MDDQVFDNEYSSQNFPNIDKIAEIFNLALAKGYLQVVAYFSGGGDQGAIDSIVAIKDKYFDDKYTDSTLNYYDLCTNLKSQSIGYDEGSLLDILQFKIKAPHQSLNIFEDFLYTHCINADFNGDVYSNGSILLDLSTGIIVTKTTQEVKHYEDLEPLNIKINSPMINAYSNDSSLIDEL